MKGITKELLVVTGGLVALYLVVVHYTGFSKVLSTSGSVYTGGVKALQGR